MALRGNEPIERVSNPLTATHKWIMDMNKNGGDIGGSLTSGYAMATDALRHGSLEAAFANQFLVNKKRDYLKDDKGEVILKDGKKVKGHDFSAKNIKKGKLIGGIIGGVGMVSAAGGAIRGILTDKNEKLDLPGIPGI